MQDLIGSLIILTGSVFLFSAGLGVLRMPDAYNRIQTGTKASTLGTMLVLLGLGLLTYAIIERQHASMRRIMRARVKTDEQRDR